MNYQTELTINCGFLLFKIVGFFSSHLDLDRSAYFKGGLVFFFVLDLEKCAHTAWSEWFECSNPCGPGQRERRRTLKSPGVKKEMCDVQLSETEPCTGTCKGRCHLKDFYFLTLL